jgi:hypothetical protein
MLDSIRLRAELFFIHRALSRVMALRCKNMLDDLRSEVTGTSSALIWQSLFADCLRVVYCAATADGFIYDPEIEGMRDLLTAAAQHYTGTPQSLYGRGMPVDLASARAFLAQYASDGGPFGRCTSVRWRGYVLCNRAAAVGESEALDRYARLMWWLIDASCQVSEVSLVDPRWHGRLPDIEELRQMLMNSGFGPQPEIERRIPVFLSKARVFTPVQQALSVFEADPFDVEMVHREARASFQRLVERATTEPEQANTGRTLLVIGGSGAGKTHLLRSFWSYIQEYGRGFVAYAQMYPNVSDYTRYLLQHIVDSLARSYSGPRGDRTGLYELASGLALLKGESFVAKVERLAELHGEPRTSLDHHVNQLVDELLIHPDLTGFDPDLLRVLLYALCLDQKATPRVYKYLRCESLNDYDRSLIGNVIPRVAKEDPKAMIRNVARLAYVARRATFVLMIDQAELSGLDSDQAMATFQGAVDALLGIVSEVPSTIAVIACLSDLYDKAIRVIGGPTRDRLEKDPAPVRLSSNLSYDEIRTVVGSRLAWMFAEAGAIYRANDPVYPIPEEQLRKFVNRRSRAILDWCQQFHDRCIAARKIVEVNDDESIVVRPPPLPLPPSLPPSPPPLDLIATAWNAVCHAPDINEPDSSDDILALVVAAANAYAKETGILLALSPRSDKMVRLRLSTEEQGADLVISVTDRGPQGGGFGTQIDNLRRAARGAIAVAVRTVEFPTGAVSAKILAQLVNAGGRTSYLDSPTVRALVAYRRFQPSFAPEHVDAWSRRDRPISSLEPIARMFDLGQTQGGSKMAVAGNGVAHGITGSTLPVVGPSPPPESATGAKRGRKRGGSRVRAVNH